MCFLKVCVYNNIIIKDTSVLEVMSCGERYVCIYKLGRKETRLNPEHLSCTEIYIHKDRLNEIKHD
jgi:hypothetical protein